MHESQALLSFDRHKVLHSMADWKNEEDIKAELRALAAELRRTREEFRGSAEPSTSNATRNFFQTRSEPREERVAAAADREKGKSRKLKAVKR
jgi:hypothetical protein